MYGVLKRKEARKQGREVSALGKEHDDVFDISREINLLQEVKDIRDELNILKNLTNQQQKVLESFCPAIEASRDMNRNQSRSHTPSMTKEMNRQARYIRELDEDAKRQYKAVSFLPRRYFAD